MNKMINFLCVATYCALGTPSARGIWVLGLCSVSLGILAQDLPSPDTVAKEAKPAARTPSWDWSKIPPVVPMPRLGSFLVPPSGPGYYSLWDQLTGNYRQAPPIYPYFPFGLYPPSFYDSDFRYLEKPDNKEKDFFDPVKRIHLGDNWLLSFGGGFWVRYMDEGKSRLTNQDNSYTLVRTRLYGDLWFQDRARLYVDFIEAHSFGEDLPPLPIDVNHFDLLNLFTDVKIGTFQDYPAYIRIGRQELLYGSQRLISTLDWANTRRTFQGVKGLWHGEKLDLDLFWARPVIPDPSHFDNWDDNQDLAGLWTTYRPRKGHFADLYFLNLHQDQAVALGSNNVKGGFTVQTIGTRYVGDYNHFLFELEGMYQFGDWSNQNISAGAVASGIGYQFTLPTNPQFWIRYDYASGDNNPGQGNTHGTFNQLFPFGHYYLGFLDQVGRQNINDFNVQFALYPTPWLTAIFQYHNFWLASARDALYNAAGLPKRQDPTGQAGRDVGDELDFRFNVHVSKHQDLFFGYSKLLAGDFIAKSFQVLPGGKLAPQPGPDVSPDLFYFQYVVRF